MSDQFYVYAYLDPRKPGTFTYADISFDYEPFYIGKGKGNRFTVHLVEKSSGNRHKYNKIQSIRKIGAEPIVLKIKEDLTEEEAWDYEYSLIESIGRSVFKTGPLTNLKDGGAGGFTHINKEGLLTFLIKKHGEEEGQKRYQDIRESSAQKLRGQKRSPEQVEALKKAQAKRYLEHPESKDLIAEGVKKYFETHDNARKGKTHTEEAKRKNSLAHLGKQTGEDNPNYGRSTYVRLLEKYGSVEGEIKYQQYLDKQKENSLIMWKNPTFKKEMSEKRKGVLAGEKNPMYGRSTQQALLEKYGPEEGAIRWEEYRQKIRESRKKLKVEGWAPSNKGRKLSTETRQRMSEAKKRWHSEKKATNLKEKE